MAARVSLEYCSVACNRNPHAASWDQSGLLAFAADKSVALAEFIEQQQEVLILKGTLHGHTEKVNCIHWVTARGRGVVGVAPRELVSGGVDKTVRVWRETNEEFTCIDVLSGHIDSVTCIAVTRTNEGAWLFSASSDSSVIVWKRTADDGQFVAQQKIGFGRGFVFCLDCYNMPLLSNRGTDSAVMFVCGGDDGKVNIFINEKSDQFKKVLCLSGHEDWIRDVSITEDDNRDLLVASCSQDTYIRLWKISQEKTTPIATNELRLHGNTFSVGSESHYTVTLEAVLYGHDDWVYSCRWSPVVGGAFSKTQPLCLLSASMDKTMILWRPDPESGVWLEQVRVGDVGGNTLGLYGAIYAPGGDIILAHGYQGAFHIWKKEDTVDGEVEKWQPLVAPSGHFGPVQDCCWEPDGRYLLSVSSDQSTRLHAPWIREGKTSWHELARPQVHGYDIQCVSPLSSLQFASGADEKVLRVFEAPRNFLGNLRRVSGADIPVTAVASDQLPLGASVPALGLSNKAIFSIEGTNERDDDSSLSMKNSFSSEVPTFTPVDLSRPPIEEHLLQSTLWPETQKLYGHGYELYSVAANGRYIASSCKASQLDYASIRIWDTSSWIQVATLAKHSLTVTQLCFSHCGDKLLAVSRDRLWSLWQFNKEGTSSSTDLVDCVAALDKASKTHTRIIWSCSWSHDDRCFATASRDKRVCVWSTQSVLSLTPDCGNGWRLAANPLELSQPVTAVDFSPKAAISDDRYLLALGLDSGEILLSEFSLVKGEWSNLMKIHSFLCHTSTVRRIQWQPIHRDHNPLELLLASCSTDCSVKILRVKRENNL